MTRYPTRSGLSVAITALLTCQSAWAQQPESPGGSAGVPPQATIVYATVAQAAPASAAQQAASEPASGQPAQLDAVEVRGEYIPEPMLQTAEVASFITREDFERTGDGDAAEALQRVSGVSIVGDKFVYVRGLGERYSSALLNGSPLPSPEPMQRVIPLDLFPSEVLQGMTVQKTYSVKYPGEFGGGVVDLQSLTIPDEPFLKFSVGGGGNSATTGEKGLTYYGSEDDWWGYDDGTRKMPRELQDAIATGQRVDLGNFSREDIRRIGRSFQNANLNVLQEKDSIDPDANFGFSAGWSAEMGDDARMGVIAVAGFENEWRTRFGDQEQGFFVGDVLEYDSDYEFLSTHNNARVNALLGIGYEWGRHRIGLNTLYVHDTIKEARSRAGVDNLAGFEARDDYTEWFEREMLNHQLSGSHAFGEYDDLKVEWRAAVARATRDVPYEKGIRYENVDGYWAHDASRVQNYTRFSAVEDEVASGGVDLTWRLPVERDLTLSTGASYMDNDRGAWSREFRFLALDGPLPFYNRYQRPDYLFSDYNLSQDLLRLRETTGSFGAAAYDATLKVLGAYAQLEGEITPNLRATLGVRYEDATQAVHPYDIFTGVRQPGPEPLRNDYFLPALTVTWNIAENRQLRFGASQTIARPQFREMAPQQYTDPDSDRLFTGNPFLVDSELTNFDARYEWFFGSGEYFTAGLFYKLIDNPIESNVNFAGGTTFQSFLNAPEATVYGAELEFKKYFDAEFQADWWTGNRLYLATNYTWTDSEVNADEDDTVQPYGFATPVAARLFVRDGSVLQGQSEHIANLQFGIENEGSGLQATLIANYVSERVSARGRPGQPDYVEEPGLTMDFVLRKTMRFGEQPLTIGFAARNLLDTEFHEYQERAGQKVNILRYDPGVSYSVSLSTEF
ncbi:TonB-dependent receptor plug domain-containing protein [Luteimonas viscosa]|uniref:TonB-dependent receptor plug domain-containing protein n=1 Tax=Luteimonas viscosa TaxID=1132694 RepID=A0A5D4XML1_9GAMM|nr:TonB-dependent receptor [Luteimonas viscosa]TYT25364.1 TonB-dependent receptor plug domain-containing protein [Luteimonas viscosa]